MAFLLVLLPLLVLAYQAYASLKHLSEQAAEINRTTIVDARRSESMTSIALEMERSYRQYCVLDDETLSTLYQSQRAQYAKMLDAHAAVLPDVRYYQNLRDLLTLLSSFKCENNSPVPDASRQLEEFSRSNAEMVQATREVIYSRGQKLQHAIAARGKFFGWQALVLFLLSGMLVLLFTRMIIGPVKDVERMINLLGEGRSPGSVARFRGPREIRALAKRIHWLSERLAWFESQRHEFLRHISHELKTPLASMREGTELLRDEVAGPLTVDQQEVVAILNTSSRHLQTLIEQLLDYNRRLADVPTDKAQLSLPEILNNVAAAHSLTARSKHIHTEIRTEATECWAESVLLMRVLDNLYSNAVHYGAESGNIWLHSWEQGGQTFIDIANSGAPIPLAEQVMIFEPFFQGSQLRKGAVKGSGLGLSIAKDCIKRMEGELTLVDVDYADVCFRIALPSNAGKT
jgi:two-component system sensor histidine kinase GlrK